MDMTEDASISLYCVRMCHVMIMSGMLIKPSILARQEVVMRNGIIDAQFTSC